MRLCGYLRKKQKMHSDNSRPPSDRRGLLFLLQPEYADLIHEEYKFEQKLEQAWKVKRLYVEVAPSLH